MGHEQQQHITTMVMLLVTIFTCNQILLVSYTSHVYVYAKQYLYMHKPLLLSVPNLLRRFFHYDTFLSHVPFFVHVQCICEVYQKCYVGNITVTHFCCMYLSLFMFNAHYVNVPICCQFINIRHNFLLPYSEYRWNHTYRIHVITIQCMH